MNAYANRNIPGYDAGNPYLPSSIEYQSWHEGWSWMVKEFPEIDNSPVVAR